MILVMGRVDIKASLPYRKTALIAFRFLFIKDRMEDSDCERKIPVLCDRLRELRGRHTQEDVARELGLTRACYAHYESGRNEPDIQTLKKLADYFHVTLDFLIRGRDPLHPSQGLSLTEEEFRILKQFKKHPLYPSLLHNICRDPEGKIRTVYEFWEIVEEERQIGNLPEPSPSESET